jgi:endonuclease/exonuclease/phosphatase (EEP) superfamily protein YafD
VSATSAPGFDSSASGSGQIGADVTCLQEVFWQRDLPLLRAAHEAYQRRGPLLTGGLVTLTSAPIEGAAFERYAVNGWLERLAWVGRMGLLVSRYRHAGEPLTVVNTHLPANYDEDWSDTNRFARRQAAELDQLAHSLHRLPAEGWLVVAGDFNVPASSRMFEDFLVAAGLVSAVDWAAWSPTGRVYHGIDNVLYRPPPDRKVSVTSRLHFPRPRQTRRRSNCVCVRPRGHRGRPGVVSESSMSGTRQQQLGDFRHNSRVCTQTRQGG